MSHRGLLLAFALLLVGCPAEPPPAPEPTAEPEPERISWELERVYGAGGPVEFVVRIERTELDLSEELRVEEELRVAPGFVAEFPDVLPEDLEGLGLARIRDLPPTRIQAKTVLRRRLLIEPEKTGDCALEERWAFFREEGQDASQETPLPSERVELKVAEIPADRSLALPEGPSIFTVDPNPRAASRWPLLALLALPLGWWLLRAARRARPEPPPPPAHEVAAEALAKLDAMDLLTQGDVEGYFVYLSAILREYVERRYRVRAPEQTTQEFLDQAQEHPQLKPHALLLRGFLTTADAVKFALERPPTESAREARDTVQSLIEATRQDRAPAPAEAAP